MNWNAFKKYALPPVASAVAAGVAISSVFEIRKAHALAGSPSGNARRYYPPSDDFPDLSQHFNIMSRNLTPKLYAKLRDITTRNGFTLDQSIQSGVDNPGHPMIRTVGMFAGDEDSYYVFSELFDPVIEQRQNGFKRNKQCQVNDLDYRKVSDGNFDPDYVLSVRMRAVRNIRGFSLAPNLTRAERRHVESVVSRSVRQLSGDLKGIYYPLRFITPEERNEWLSESILFEKPTYQVHLSAGFARDWPDARGVFMNEDKSLVVWTNECEDHIRVISRLDGGNVRQAFETFCLGLNEIEKNLNKDGYEFMHDPSLGYLSSCPSNLGTGLRASVYIKLPLLQNNPKFNTIIKRLNLHKRKANVDGDGVAWDISNAERLGNSSEVELVKQLIDGIRLLLKMEKRLETGKGIDSLIP